MSPLSELFEAVPEKLAYPGQAAALSIAGITSDSRQAGKGFLFAALRGERSDGAQFIAQAEAAGAVAVLCDKDAVVTGTDIAVIRAENPRRALSHIAARFYGSQPAHIAAITGTDGKTSTADFFRQFWHHLGRKSVSIGTLGVLSGAGEMLSPGSHTTPDPVQLHELLANLSDKKIEYVGMEASSHGLDQYRIDGVNLEAAAFTNIARDHLDYHKTETAYFSAKARLFSELLPEGKTAVLNQDDARFAALGEICARRKHNIIGFGRQGKEFTLVNLTPAPHGQRAELQLLGRNYTLEIPLVGAFQVMNILAALGLVVGAGGALEQALAAVPKLKGVPGRLEQVARLKN
ncbi:MAG: UDP-N-acetylmuramoyl-L-alanyl-D-glutamate--2,6-diaminopimelate ligase, partial [Pseudomonadota bacterium]|nr:UDP-N-acetylmuramoyl-L-alanyl-D-glutamate--2,6-diaminopimelate ligase [Pseudomonadota bacterium]